MDRLNFALFALAGAFWGCSRPNPQYCESDAACPSGMTCDLVHRQCTSGSVDAAVDFAMPDLATPDLSTGCTTSATCTDPMKPICTNMMCAGCTKDAQCMSKDPMRPICNMNQCVQCQTSMDCMNPLPFCDQTGTCAKCTANNQCTSLLCKSDGTCEDPNNITYVDSGNNACSNAKGSGTMATPYCQIQNAITANLGKPIVVYGSNTPYMPLNIGSMNATITLIGPGRDAMPAAVVSSANATTAINLAGAGNTVTVDGFDVKSTMGYGVYCAGGNMLTILRSRIHNCGIKGVSINNCDAVLDEDRLNGNSQGGFQINFGSYKITNCMVVENNGPGPGNPAVDLSGGTGLFQHNTVAANVQMVGIGGVSCGMNNAKAIENSIIWGNSQSSGTQLFGNCTLTNVDIDETATGMGVRSMQPDFTADYHLVKDAPNMACCIDQIQSSQVDHDFDGTPRPQPVNGKFDIGAHEVK